VAILAALARRERSGIGQHIDLALLDVQIACLANQATNYIVGGVVPRRIGNAHPNIVPYQDFPTADGHMIIAVGNDSQFASLCTALGKPEWGKDERFASNPRRVKNRNELIAMICGITVSRATGDWIAAMEAAGVPCGPINNLDQVFEDPQVQSRNVRIEMSHPLAKHVALVANPIRMSESPVQYRQSPPTLGQHTGEVLQDWLDMAAADIDELRRTKLL
jgi:crotonobetainyl-CoA:carnitine CoA-transferase CaiB-like acyl-CoA transferase